jgi:hypothetical protein
MNTNKKYRNVALPILTAACAVFLTLTAALFQADRAYAVIGQSYNSMVGKYGQPEPMPLNTAVGFGNLQRYQASGISVSAYRFQVSGFKMITLFNPGGVCYEMKTFNNRLLPNPKDLIGSLAGTKPVVLNRIPLRAITLQYGTGLNAVIYETFGPPSDLSAVAYSPALKP